MPFYLALDAGGTKTECWLADDSGVLARAITGSIKLMRVGEPEATARLSALLHEVSTTAGVPLYRIHRTCVGLAGISILAVRSWAERTLSSLVSGDILLTGDEEIALDAAFRGEPGILVIAGTGSNIVGRSSGGFLYRAGGWGPAIGDEGSGHWIGVEALRSALHALDRSTDPNARIHLLDHVQQHWQLTSIGDLVAYSNATPAPNFSALAPVVGELAAAGDPVAIDVLTSAGSELARQVAVVANRMQASALDIVPIAYTGSVLTHLRLVRQSFVEAIHHAYPHAEFQPEPVVSLEGALWRARNQPASSSPGAA